VAYLGTVCVPGALVSVWWVMSVEVMNAQSASGSTAPGVIRSLSNDLYNMLISDTPQQLPPPLSPSAPAASSVPPAALSGVPEHPKVADVGCSMAGLTRTVIVIGGVNGSKERLNVALEKTVSLSRVASARGNQVHIAFLGGALPPHGSMAKETALQHMVTIAKYGSAEHGVRPENVHLIVGPREIQALSILASPSIGGGDALPVSPEDIREYLLRSKLLEWIGPSAPSNEQERDIFSRRGSAKGLWLKTVSTQGGSMVGKFPGVGVVGAGNKLRAEWISPPEEMSSLLAWKDKLNDRWKVVVQDPLRLRQAQPDRWQFWMTLGVQGTFDEEDKPATNLGLENDRSAAVFARPGMPFGMIKSTLTIERRTLLSTTAETWMDVGVVDTGVSWAVQTWCYGTTKAMNAHTLPMLDRTPSIAELQYDVSCTLSSLVQHADRAQGALEPPSHPWANFGDMRGVLGPCVVAGREGQEVMRVICWTSENAPAVTLLLSEAYVRHVLSDYYQERLGAISLGGRAVSGFLALSDEDEIPIRFPDLSEAEQSYATQAFGSRIWRTGRGSASSRDSCLGALKDMQSAPASWRSLLSYAVEGSDSSSADALRPGQRVHSSSGAAVFYVHTTSADPLMGLSVRWVFAPKEGATGARDMPTLDVANDAFEHVL
jgi:hypothetical protein